MHTKDFTWHFESGNEIFVREWAPEGEIRAVIGLVHGLGEHIGRYHHVACQLTEAGYALVGFDLPGHGRSGGVRGYSSYEEASQKIDRLFIDVKQRYAGKPLFLYGHSMGGAIVLYYILKRQLNHNNLHGAIVTSPVLAPGQPVPTWKQMIAKVFAYIWPSFRMGNGLDRENLSRDQTVVQAYKDDPLVHDRVSASLGLDLLTKGEWILDHAQTFPVPLLLMRGSEDHIVSPEYTDQLANRLPAGNLTYQVWEGFYHELHNAPEKEQVVQTLIKWLNRHT